MKGGSRFANMMNYEAGKTYHVEAVLSTADRNIQVYVDGKRVGLRMFYAPVATIERIAFRTGEMRTFPTVDTPADQTYDLPDAGGQEPLAEYRIARSVILKKCIIIVGGHCASISRRLPSDMV